VREHAPCYWDPVNESWGVEIVEKLAAPLPTRTILDLIARTDQWELLKNGADMTVAVEEFIRYVTPIHNMCRVAAADTVPGTDPVEMPNAFVYGLRSTHVAFNFA